MKLKENRTFFKGAMSLSLSVILTKILGVAFKVPLSYILTDEGMGYFNTAYAIYGLFYILCTAGVPKSLMLVIATRKSEGKGVDDDREVLKCALAMFAKIGALATLLNIICAPAFASAVGNNSASLSIAFVAPSIFFVSLGGVLRGYLNSRERLSTIAISQLIESVIKLVLGLAFAYLGVHIGASLSTISAMAIAGITVGCATSFFYMYMLSFYHKNGNKPRQKGLIEYKNIRRKILKNALPIAISSALLNLASTLDLTMMIKQLVKGGMSEEYASAIYGNYTTLAVPMFTLVISVLTPIATSYMPRLSALYLAGEEKEFTDSVNKLLYVTLFISVPASLAFYFYSFDLLDVIFSLQSSATGADMLTALSLGLCLLSALTVVNTALESRGKIFATVLSLLLGCVVKLFVSYMLLGNNSVGMLGAPIGTVISYAVSLAVSLFILSNSGVRIYAIAKALLLYSLGLLAFYAPYKLLYSTSPFGAFISMLVALLVSGGAYLLLTGATYLFLSYIRCLKCTKKNIAH